MPLSDLAAALAAATGPDRALDVMLAGLVFYRQPLTGGWSGIDEPWAAEDIAVALEGEHTIKVPAYTSDLNAITGAIEQRWPIVKWSVTSFGEANVGTQQHFGYVVGGHMGRSALALCLAAVRLALAEEGR